MGDRGQLFHVPNRATTLVAATRDFARAAAKSGARLAVVATNRRWTSFVPIGRTEFDAAMFAARVDRPVLHVQFDDDHGLVASAYAPGAFLGELALPLDDDAAWDDALLAAWQTNGLLTRTQRLKLAAQLGARDRRAWTLDHGFERTLDLASHAPLPRDVDELALRSILPPTAVVIEPGGAPPTNGLSEALPAEVATSSATKTEWTGAARQTLALHGAYWSEVWSMNNWKLYNRYKKHLPPDQRADVDRLCDAVAAEDEAAILARVESILARIWPCEDWDRVIRDANLEDGDEGVWAAWRARLAGRD